MKTSTLLFFFCLGIGNGLYSQSILKISSEIYKAYDEMEGAVEDLMTVQSIVKAIENGEEPDSEIYSDWSVVANNYRKAAKTLREAPLVTEFDPQPYALSLDELRNCYDKEENFDKLKGFAAELDDAIQRGEQELTKINEQKQQVEKTKEALRYLIDIQPDLISVPIFGELFVWDWFALENNVRPAVNDYASALKKHEDRLVKELTSIRQQVSNLTSNTELLESSICLIEGKYTGSFVDDGETFVVTLLISKSGNNYYGVFTIAADGESLTQNTSRIEIQTDHSLDFTITKEDEVFSFTGTLSQDFMEIRNLRDVDEDLSVTVRK